MFRFWSKAKNIVFVVLISTYTFSLLIIPLPAQYNQSSFQKFTSMRVGNGKPVYWYCFGEIYEYPTGKMLAKVIGVDTAKKLNNESDSKKVVQLSRKIFFYLDPKTEKVLDTYNGERVEHIAYPYQVITYQLVGDKLETTVVQGKKPRIQNIKSNSGNYIRRVEGGVVFSSPLFINSPNYKAYENYDFFIPENLRGNKIKYFLSWNRRGQLPAFFGGDDSVFQLVSYRVDNYINLPIKLRQLLETRARLWMAPPKDLKEIEELQN